MPDVTVTRFSERFTRCASCSRQAAFWVNGTTSCPTHVDLWVTRWRAGGFCPDCQVDHAAYRGACKKIQDYRARQAATEALRLEAAK